MIMTNKLLPVALVAALLGGSVGAYVMHSKKAAEPQSTVTNTQPSDAQYAQLQSTTPAGDQLVPAVFNSVAEQTAYKS